MVESNHGFPINQSFTSDGLLIGELTSIIPPINEHHGGNHRVTSWPIGQDGFDQAIVGALRLPSGALYMYCNDHFCLSLVCQCFRKLNIESSFSEKRVTGCHK